MVTNKGSYFREPVPLWLVDRLNEQFPNSIPERRDFDLESLRVKQGQRMVISYIEAIIKNELEE